LLVLMLTTAEEAFCAAARRLPEDTRLLPVRVSQRGKWRPVLPLPWPIHCGFKVATTKWAFANQRARAGLAGKQQPKSFHAIRSADGHTTVRALRKL